MKPIQNTAFYRMCRPYIPLKIRKMVRERQHLRLLKKVQKTFNVEEFLAQDGQLRRIYKETVFLLAKHGVEKWWEFDTPHTGANYIDAPKLRYWLNYLLLHRAGDYREYLRLTKEMNNFGCSESAEDTFLRLMAEYYAVELAAIEQTATNDKQTIAAKKPLFLIALLVWGEKYLEPMMQWALPSLLADGNLNALCKEREVVILFHTDEKGKEIIANAPIIKEIAQRGVHLRFMMLNQPLLAKVGELDNNKYWHLGMVQSLHLHYAKALNADFHIMLPDKIYARDYFDNLLRMGSKADVVLQWSFRTNAETILPDLMAYRQGNALSVPAPDLAALMLNHLHAENLPLSMNHRPHGDRWPAFHGLLWEGEDELHAICPHQDMVYLGRQISAKLTPRFYFTLDSEIEKIIPEDCSIICPKAEDGLVLIEFSPSAIQKVYDFVPIHTYAQSFWSRVESKKHLRFFGQDIVFPIDKKMRHRHGFIPQETIAREKAFIRDAVDLFHPVAPMVRLMNGLYALHAAETCNMAQTGLEILHQQARAIWEDGKRFIDPLSNPDHVKQTARMLWNFDLLPEAAELLSHYPWGESAHTFIKQTIEKRAENDVWANAWKKSNPDTKQIYVFGITVWGAVYTEFMLDYHFPSLLADGNIPTLSKQGRVIVSIATDAAGKSQILAHPAYTALATYAEFHFTLFEAAPSRATTQEAEAFYQRYGILDHHHVYLARTLAADLFLMPPDCILSDSAFGNFAKYLKAGFDCCTVAPIEADRTQVLTYLDSKKDKKTHCLSIDAAELLQQSIDHKTDYFRSIILAENVRPNAYPREFFWLLEDGYVCHSIFMHPMAVSHRALTTKIFHPNHENTDYALIPRLLQGSDNIKIIDNALEAIVMHCSDKEVRANEYGSHNHTVNTHMLAHLVHVHRHDFPIHRKCLHTAQFFPCKDPEIKPSTTYKEDIAFLQTHLAAFDGQ